MHTTPTRQGRLVRGPLAALFASLPAALVACTASAAPTATEILDAVEQSDEKLSSLQAKVSLTNTFELQGDTVIKQGSLAYQSNRDPDADPETHSKSDDIPDRRLAVTFDQEVVGVRREADPKTYIFDGESFVEIRPADKQYIRTQVARPGEKFDPLTLGEGPFPSPIGQRKADILERFEAAAPERLEGLPEPYHAYAKRHELTQLHLTPKEGTDAWEEFDQIRIWYRIYTDSDDGSVWVPQVMRVVKPIGDEMVLVLVDPRINEPIDPRTFDPRPPPRGARWNVLIKPLRDPTSDATTDATPRP